MQMRVLSTRTMIEDGDKHKNNENEAAKHRCHMRLPSTRTMPNEVAKHKNNANENAKHKNNGRRR